MSSTVSSPLKPTKPYDQLFTELQRANQLHLLQHYHTLTPQQQQTLLSQLSQFDFDHLNQIFQQSTQGPTTNSNNNNGSNNNDDDDDYQNIQPPPKSCIDSLSQLSDESIGELYNQGLRLVQQNKVAVLLLAGGQGTRLGSRDPKGMYDMNLLSGKSLFQIQSERLLKLQQLAQQQLLLTTKQQQQQQQQNQQQQNESDQNIENVIIPYYILTSPQNHEETKHFFRTHDYFGLSEHQIHFFSQELLPCFEIDTGKILMETEYTLALAPNGNGGVYQALEHCALYADMLNRGIEHIHSYSIDNVLVKPADPVFMSFCANRRIDFGTKVVPKVEAHERVGVFALKNGRFHVVEYSEISREMAERREEESGELAFRAANIVNFYYSIDFLHKCAQEMEIHKVYHVAKKTVPCIGNPNPTKANGIKLELFNFDICQFADKVAILLVDRSLEFSPLKNAPGEGLSDSPETCRQDLSRVCKMYIRQAGGRFVNDDDNDHRVPPTEKMLCEISPLLTYGGEGLEERVQGKEFTLPLYLE